MISFGTSAGHANALDWGDIVATEPTDDYMAGLWFLELLSDTAGTLVADKLNTSTANRGWLLRPSDSGTSLRVLHANGSAGTTASFGTGVLELGGGVAHSAFWGWLDIGGTRYIRFYFDGIFLAQIAVPEVPGNNAHSFTIGNRGALDEGYAGAVGHCAFWKDLNLSADLLDQYAGIFHAGQQMPRSERLVFWYKGTANPGRDEISHAVPTVAGTVSLVADAVDALYQGETFVPQPIEIMSRDLRRNRFPMLTIPIALGPDGADLEVGDPMAVALPDMPRAASLVENIGSDQLARTGQAPFGFVGPVGFDPNTLKHSIEMEEWEHAIATFWSTYKAFAVDEQRDGLAMINNGAEKTFSRGTPGWLLQSDGTIARVGPGYEKINHQGLWIEPRRKNLIKNSNFALTSITTNWTDNSGDGSGVEVTDPTHLLFADAAMYPRALLITKGTGNTLWTADAVAVLTADGKHRMQIWRKGEGAQVGSWRLRRSSDSWYWSDSAETWQSGSVFNVMPESEAYEPHYSNPIDVPGDTNWTLDIGVTSGLQGDEVYFGQMDIQNTRFACSPIVSGAAAYEQDEDALVFASADAARQLVYAKRHTIRATVQAMQNAADLEDDDVLVFAYGQFGSTDSYAALYYEKPIGASAQCVFAVKAPGETVVKATLLADIVMGTTYEVMGRLDGLTASVLVDGIKGTDATAPAVLDDTETDSEFRPGSAPDALGWHRACCIISDPDVQQRAVPDEEALALR